MEKVFLKLLPRNAVSRNENKNEYRGMFDQALTYTA